MCGSYWARVPFGTEILAPIEQSVALFIKSLLAALFPGLPCGKSRSFLVKVKESSYCNGNVLCRKPLEKLLYMALNLVSDLRWHVLWACSQLSLSDMDRK